MKHNELLKLLYTHKESIDRAYREGFLENVSQELIESTLFVKINEKYKLNKNYINFADSILQRVDYSIIFGNYENEYKELVKLKKRYQESNDYYYIETMLVLIETLYFKFLNRDREIQVLLVRLENDTSLEIDILIQNGGDILEKVSELIDANKKIGLFFRQELRGLAQEIDSLLQSVNISLLGFIENIDYYIKQLNQFLIQTKKRRLQNKQLMQVSNQILDEETQNLESQLSLHFKKYFFTIHQSQKNKINFLAQESDFYKISKEIKALLGDLKIEKPLSKRSIKHQEVQKLSLIDVEAILHDLSQAKSEDIFLFLYQHKELQKYQDQELVEEAFKVYMYIVSAHKVHFSKNFNAYGIKVAQWV